MNKMNNEKSRLQNGMFAAAGFIALGLLLFNTGCGRPESPPADDAGKESLSPSVEASEPQDAVSTTPMTKPDVPAPAVPEDAPVLRKVYPVLSRGPLGLARLTELPDNVLLQAKGVSITESDLKEKLAQAPAHVREELSKNKFFLLEQQATTELLKTVARQQIKDRALSEDKLIQRYFEDITRNVTVTEPEIELFYKENPDLMGNSSLKQIKPRIREHLQQQKQQNVVQNHIAEIGNMITVALDAKWIKEQAAMAMDNPVDKARASGKPTFANFGAEGCGPCEMMEPIRKEIASEYNEQLNVVYVHVNQDQILASRYGVSGIPHLIFFDENGKEIHTHTGFMPKEQIEKWIKKSGISDP